VLLPHQQNELANAGVPSLSFKAINPQVGAADFYDKNKTILG